MSMKHPLSFLAPALLPLMVLKPGTSQLPTHLVKNTYTMRLATIALFDLSTIE